MLILSIVFKSFSKNSKNLIFEINLIRCGVNLFLSLICNITLQLVKKLSVNNKKNNDLHLPENGLELFDQPISKANLPLANGNTQGSKRLRKTFAIFLHSMERNGANNFCLFLLRALVRSNKYIVFAPKDGPMKSDFESLSADVEVIIINPNDDNFLNILEDHIKQKQVSVMLANTIMRCDVIATGVVQAARALGLEKPLVVRLEGTNVEAGKDILSSSGLAIIPADNLADAATKIVAAVKGN